MSGLRALCARLGRPTLPGRSADGPSRALAPAAGRAAPVRPGGGLGTGLSPGGHDQHRPDGWCALWRGRFPEAWPRPAGGSV